MQILRVVSIILLVIGFGMVAMARWAVEKFELNRNAVCDFEHEMSEDELKQYKVNKAVVNFKMLGMLVALPGLVLFIIGFR